MNRIAYRNRVKNVRERAQYDTRVCFVRDIKTSV